MEDRTEIILQALRAMEKRPLLVAIDGCCAAGKTTLAARLREKTGCSVIHMDQFFLRPEQRTGERLAQPGGNVDRERFWEEVMEPLRRGEPFSYRAFDCGKMALGEEIFVRPGDLTVIEGSYSCHPALWNYYDLRVFLRISPEEQLFRIRRRNGDAGLEMFRRRWIPLEEQYFAAFQTAERCDLVFSD